MRLIALRDIADSVTTIRAWQTFEAQQPAADRLLAAGEAVPADRRLRWPDGPQWDGTSVVAIASGPSLTREDVEMVRAWRNANHMMRLVAVINTSYQIAPWANLVYACDARWWDMYERDVRTVCRHPAQLWTQDRKAAEKYGLRRVRCRLGGGLCREPGVVHAGDNSGYQLLGLLYHAGVRRVVLLGYDMKYGPNDKSHWHGDHPPKLRSFPMWEKQTRNFNELARDLSKPYGMEVVNASRDTAITAFPRVGLSDALALHPFSIHARNP